MDLPGTEGTRSPGRDDAGEVGGSAAATAISSNLLASRGFAIAGGVISARPAKGVISARHAKGVDGLGEGELLAAEAGDEAAAAHVAAGLQATEDVEEFAPRWCVGLAGEEIAEEDAVAGEQHAGEGFESGVGAAGGRDGSGGAVMVHPTHVAG